MRILRSGLLLFAALALALPVSAQDDSLGGEPDDANAPGLRFKERDDGLVFRKFGSGLIKTLQQFDPLLR